MADAGAQGVFDSMVVRQADEGFFMQMLLD
jgi:hypothetical protein